MDDTKTLTLAEIRTRNVKNDSLPKASVSVSIASLMALCATVYPSFRCIKGLGESRPPPPLSILQTSQAVSSRALSSEGPGPTTSDTESAPGSTPDLSVQSPAHQLIDPFHPPLNRKSFHGE